MTPDQRDRYSRQILFSPIGEAGQERLLASRVAIVGCGALGSFHAAALARAGVGTLRLIDRDYVEPSNLQRQWLYDEADAAEALPKAAAAARAIARFNSSITVEPLVADLTPATADDLLADVDLILDGTDNFETRYLINDFALSHQVPWIYGAAVGSYGLTMPILPGQTCCLQCVYPAPPTGAQPTCETDGVLSSVTTAIGALQVGMAIKLLTGSTPAFKITTLDVWNTALRQIDQPPPDPDCPACGRREFIYLDGERRAPISLCGRNAVQIHERNRPLNLPELAARLERLGTVRQNDFALRFFLPPYELTIFADGRAIIKGTQDVGVARSLYARYIGT
ncbi:MAG: ThiF family adenylyltransferase [Acidobacteria bacterium]|nr:ThiF family adenylyltransferase [Acidobacteriota bacterium]